ncbi:MAG: (d)CMP kinase [Candidatus Thermoplasmatota archaeon]
MIITISGPPGSGKSTIGRMLAERLGWDYISVGEIFRQMATDRGMSLAEFSTLAERKHSIDLDLDRRVVDAVQNSMVVEGRLAAHMLTRHRIPALKVWIDADTEERAMRVARREYASPEAVLGEIEARESSERRRYKEIYGIDAQDTAIYDIVIDSTHLNPSEILKMIMEAMALEAS